MTTPQSLPSLPGLGWSRHKIPTFNTRIQPHVSGREVRIPLQVYPIYQFELTFEALASDSSQLGLSANSLQTLMGFYLQMQGAANVFLYSDPDDHTQAHTTAFALGDGSTTSFSIMRTLGGFVEPVGWVTTLTAVYVAGVLVDSGYTLTTPNTLAFSVAPANGATIGADFNYSFQCRFEEDSIDFEEFMANLWALQSLKFRSVKPPPL